MAQPQFRLRTLLIVTAIIAADSGILAHVGSANVVLWLGVALASLSAGIGGILLTEAARSRRADAIRTSVRPRGTLLDRITSIGTMLMGACSVWWFMVGAVLLISLNLLAMFSQFVDSGK
jgi:hypothetical protein